MHAAAKKPKLRSLPHARSFSPHILCFLVITQRDEFAVPEMAGAAAAAAYRELRHGVQ